MFPSGSVCSIIYLKYNPSFLFRHPYIPPLSRVCLQMWWSILPSDFNVLSICSSTFFYSFISVLILHINRWLYPPLPLFTSLRIPNPQNMNSVPADVLLVVYVCVLVCVWETALCVRTIASLCLSLLGSRWSPHNASLICTWHTEYTCANMGRHPLRREQGVRCGDEGDDGPGLRHCLPLRLS